MATLINLARLLSSSRVRRTWFALAFALTAFASHPAANAGITPTGEWNLLVIRVDFNDAPGVRWTQSEFENIYVSQLVSYFSDLSNGQFSVNPTVVPEVIRLRDRRFYHPGDFAGPGESTRFFGSDAVATAYARGLIQLRAGGFAPLGGDDSDVFTAVLVVFSAPSSWPLSYYGSCGSGFGAWSTAGCVDLDGADGDCDASRFPGFYQFAVASEDDGDCLPVIEPVADVGAAVHELAHTIVWTYGNGGTHPSGYANRFELLDNCAPCYTGAQTRMSTAMKGEGFPEYFPGWLDDSKIARFDPPSSGTEVLSPIESDPDDVASPMALRVGTADGTAYVVECRRPLGWDAGVPIPDTGVVILKLTPSSSSPETTFMPPPGSPPDATNRAWKPGDVFTDAVRDVRISVGPNVATGCTVTVDYGPSALVGVPDVGLTPWLTPPNHTWETVDIWVDSSCNGYEQSGGVLRYGRDLATRVIGNGDDPCANAENRIYAKIRNYGAQKADNVTARIYVTRPLGVGIRGPDDWDLVGVATPAQFPALTEIRPGQSVDVWVPWTPNVTSGPSDGAFPFHSCLQVKVDPVAGERVLGNQDGDREQENISYFEARLDLIEPEYSLIEDSITISNEENSAAEYSLSIDSQLPPGWELTLNNGDTRFELNPQEVRTLPIIARVPSGASVGAIEQVRVEAFRKEYDTVDGVGHWHDHPVGGALLNVHTVLDTAMTIAGRTSPPDVCSPQALIAEGCLNPAIAGQIVSVGFKSPTGASTRQQATTASNGCYSTQISNPVNGNWTLDAFWHGDMNHGSAKATVMKLVGNPLDIDCDTVLNTVDNCPDVVNTNQKNSDNDPRGDACDCAPTNGTVHAAPGFVTNVMVRKQPNNVRVSWDSQSSSAGSGTKYDLVGDSLKQLLNPNVRFSTISCLANDVTGTQFTPGPPNPIPGDGHYYLVRGQNSCGTGSYDGPGPTATSRDLPISNASGRCP